MGSKSLIKHKTPLNLHLSFSYQSRRKSKVEEVAMANPEAKLETFLHWLQVC